LKIAELRTNEYENENENKPYLTNQILQLIKILSLELDMYKIKINFKKNSIISILLINK